MAYAISTDTGGTFTDVVIAEGEVASLYKHPTTADQPVRGLIAAVEGAAEALGLSLPDLLARTDRFLHATTRPLNALLAGETARTALITTEGHRDILYFREGGRRKPFLQRDFPQPFVPRHLTFEVKERLDRDGAVVTPLDEAAVERLGADLAASGVEAVAICLLWSCVDGRHEDRVAEILGRHLPGVPITRSHVLNPTIREYRRAQSACLDAALKGLVADYLETLADWLRGHGFRGNMLVTSSQGGALSFAEAGGAPLHLLKSGPALAPVAGRRAVPATLGAEAVVFDIGGTSCDISLVRGGAIPWAQETWLGEPFHGILTGLPSIDVRSIAAGGGSYAWLDAHGLLRLGPKSAGADPGPVCYDRGGSTPTVTDAAAVLGLLDPDYFLGGRLPLDVAKARAAIAADLADPLGLSVEACASTILTLFSERVAAAIADLTVEQGVDSKDAVLVCGGGAVGFGAAEIARRLGARHLVIPWTGAVLSASGGVLSDLSRSYSALAITNSEEFDAGILAAAQAKVEAECRAFLAANGPDGGAGRVDYWIQARYAGQVWDIEIDYRPGEESRPEALCAILAERFHDEHERRFGVRADTARVEFIALWGRAVHPSERRTLTIRPGDGARRGTETRRVHLRGQGWRNVPVFGVDAVAGDAAIEGPLILESAFTTILIEAGMWVAAGDDGYLQVEVADAADDRPDEGGARGAHALAGHG